MKLFLGLISLLIIQICNGQTNYLIGDYKCNYPTEYIKIKSDTLIEFDVSYPSCFAVHLYGYDKYRVKKDRLITQTINSTDNQKTQIYFKILKDSNQVSLIGPFYLKNLRYRSQCFKHKLHYIIHGHFRMIRKTKACPLEFKIYEQQK